MDGWMCMNGGVGSVETAGLESASDWEMVEGS